MRKTAFLALLLITAAQTVAAESFQRVTDRDTFVALVEDQALKRFAVDVVVTPDGQIAGRAFGGEVSGSWTWRDGFFCRELNWAGDPFDSQCQTVEVSGDTLRFTADRGQGRYADLRLD